MARFLCLSDLHIDINAGHDSKFFLTPEQEKEVDGVLIAGDIAGAPDEVIEFLKKAYPNVPVAFLSGNHIVYHENPLHKSLDAIHGDLRLAVEGTNYHFLENDAVVIGDVAIIGTNLYTDYKYGRRGYLPQYDKDGDPIAKGGRKLKKHPFIEWWRDPANKYYHSLDCPEEERVAAQNEICCPANASGAEREQWAKDHPEAYQKLLDYEADRKNHWVKKETVAEFQKNAMSLAQRYMNDFRWGYSNRLNGLGLFDHLAPGDYLKYHKKAVNYIRKAYAKYSAMGYKVVVMTHHAPHPQCLVPYWRGADTAPSYTSDLTKLLREISGNTAFWLFGHTHSPIDITVEGVRIINNSYGYASMCESKGFNKDLIIEI